MTTSENAEVRTEPTHPAIDPHASHITNRLNWLRAGVLAATTTSSVIFTVGLAAGGRIRELAGLYAAKGLSAETARVVARELTEGDGFAAHVDVELGIDPDDLSSPWQAALSSAVAFTLGGARKRRANLRVVLAGALAMLVTYSIGEMVGMTI